MVSWGGKGKGGRGEGMGWGGMRWGRGREEKEKKERILRAEDPSRRGRRYSRGPRQRGCIEKTRKRPCKRKNANPRAEPNEREGERAHSLSFSSFLPSFLPSPTPLPSQAFRNRREEHSLSSLSRTKSLHRQEQLLHISHSNFGVAHGGGETRKVVSESGEVAGGRGGGEGHWWKVR